MIEGLIDDRDAWGGGAHEWNCQRDEGLNCNLKRLKAKPQMSRDTLPG